MKVDTNHQKIKELVNSRFIHEVNATEGKPELDKRERKKLEKLLQAGKRLTLYHGVDPTAPDLHLGHSTNFLLLKEFQKLGHRVIFLIGDFTARIGDPTGKDTTREPLSSDRIRRNMKTYLQQVYKLLPKGSFETKYNSSWLGKMSLEDAFKLFSQITVGRLSKRNMFREREKKKKPLAVHEFLYPLMQGYDSVALKTDIEIGGLDQTFNMMIGRDLVKAYLKKEKFVITTPLLENPRTKRKLMSKSEGGYISLQDSPGEMFGKTMALPDEVVIDCLTLCTLYPKAEIEKIDKNLKNKKFNPRDAKMILAYEVVSLYHGKQKAKAASEEFKKVFQRKELPVRIPVVKLQLPIRDLVYVLIHTKFASSKSNAWRLIKQGGVKVDGRTILVPSCQVLDGALIQVGKRHFIRTIYKK